MNVVPEVALGANDELRAARAVLPRPSCRRLFDRRGAHRAVGRLGGHLDAPAPYGRARDSGSRLLFSGNALFFAENGTGGRAFRAGDLEAAWRVRACARARKKGLI